MKILLTLLTCLLFCACGNGLVQPQITDLAIVTPNPTPTSAAVTQNFITLTDGGTTYTFQSGVTAGDAVVTDADGTVTGFLFPSDTIAGLLAGNSTDTFFNAWSGATKGIRIQFSGNTPGTYTMTASGNVIYYIDSNNVKWGAEYGSANYSTGTSISTTVTAFGAVGGFINGSYTATLYNTNSTSFKTVSGTFSVKRFNDVNDG